MDETLKSCLTSLTPAENIADSDPAKNGCVLTTRVPLDKIPEAARAFREKDFILECMTAVDYPDHFDLVYTFTHWDHSDRYLVKASAPKPEGPAPSLTNLFPAANWFEREVYDMYGCKFSGHPRMTRLLLPKQSKIHPLLKSFNGLDQPSDKEDVLALLESEEAEYDTVFPTTVEQYQKDFYLNMGPQHPSTHGVLRMLLHLSGEKVLDGDPVIGYSHRAHEKMAEVQTYLQFWPNTGRLDYVGAMSYNFGYALVVEKMMGVVAPPRAQAIRVLTTELNRISSHLLWLGTYLLDLGALTPFFYAFDDREQILEMLESVTGERLTYDYFRFGGVNKDVPADFFNQLKVFIPRMRQRLKDYQRLIEKNIIFQKRTRGIGVITRRMALDYGVSGPSLRASGVPYDIRKVQPYSLYPELQFDIPTATEGDAFARYWVRMQEIEQSLRIAEQVAAHFPDGEISSGRVPKAVPAGECYSAVESARGSFGIYLVSDGSQVPYRLKLRTPSFSNLNALVAVMPGYRIADIVAILGSIDIVLPEIDR